LKQAQIRELKMTKSFTLPSERWEQKFSESAPLYSDREALAEARRCLFCFDAPCIKACPTAIDIPTFIRKIAEGNLRGAAKTVLSANILGYSCGRVCPDKVLCAGSCVLKDYPKPTIEIARLHRYATERFLLEGQRVFSPAPPTGKRIALVGAGPASLACAHELRLLGHQPTIFEKNAFPGGLNTTGIAPYKMQADDALLEAEYICNIGIEIRTGVEVGGDIDAKSLLKSYDAVFIGVGLGEDTKLKVSGEEDIGVVGAVSWIDQMKMTKRAALDASVQRALVVGGGNTALDAARELLQFGVPVVTMVYRRTAQVMPGFHHEMDAARREGMQLLEHAVITEIVREGMRLKGARIRTSDEEIFMRADLIIVAIGQSMRRETLSKFAGVELNTAGEIVVDPATGRTSNPRIYAGGDATPGMKLVVQAVADGKRAARTIHEDLMQNVKGGR
jgi:glutamate synthase (NADPH/NADH) small chain